MPALRPLTASVCCDLTANLADLGDLGGSAPDVVRTSFYITDTVSGIRCHRIISHSWAAKPVSEGLPIFMLFLIQCFSSHVITLHIISNTLFIFSTYLFPRRSCRTSPISLQGSLNLHLLDLLHRGRLSVTVQNRKLTCFLSLQKKKARQTHSCHSGAARGLTDSERHILPEQIQYLPNKYMMQDQREDNRSESTHTETLEMKDQTSEELFLREHRRREMSERRLFLLWLLLGERIKALAIPQLSPPTSPTLFRFFLSAAKRPSKYNANLSRNIEKIEKVNWSLFPSTAVRDC